MKWTLKRPLCVLVSCMMLLSAIPTTAWAEDTALNEVPAQSVSAAETDGEEEELFEDAAALEAGAQDVPEEQEPEATPASTPEAAPEATPEAAPEATPEAAPEATPETAPEATPEAAPEATPEAVPEATPEAASQPAAQPMGEIPPETSTVDYSKTQSESVTYDGYKKEGDVYKFYYTIHEGAGDDLVIDLSQCALSMWEDESQMPGMHYKFQIILQNESGNLYRYKDNSFVLAPGDASEFGSLEDGSLMPVLTYDGQYLPLQFTGAMIPYYFYKDVFGVSSSGNVTFEMMCQIYDYLAEKGYTGSTAITDYMLDYYNAKRNTDYTSLSALFADHPDWVEGSLVTNNGIWTMTEAQLQAYIEQYPWVDQYVYVKEGSSGTLNVQIKWPEPELAAVSYNSFYMGLFSVVYGKENAETLNPNGDGVAFSRAHAVGDYLPGTDLYKETNTYFEGLTDTPLASGESLEIWSGYGIDGPGMGNVYQNYAFTYYNIIELEQVKPIQMSLCDITIYTGGNGYDGVVDGTVQTAADNGFPTPGFYITLPDELNEKLGSIQNLANIITLKYDDGKGDTRSWNLELYGTTEHSTDEGGYIYKFVTTGGDLDYVRIQLQSEDGQYIMSDDFEAFLNLQYKEYQMAVYNGAIDANYVTAEVKVNGKTYVYPIEEGTAATLTIRANIDEMHADVVASQDEIASGDFAAVADENVDYYVNDKDVQLADASGVKLMVDEILDDNVLVDHLKTNPEVTLPKGNLVFVQKYMDLVDANNGDTYLTLGDDQSVTVYWPVPDDYVENGEAIIYHFDGVDRDYNTGEVIENVDALIQIKPEMVTVNGTKYFAFTTSSFSPFVLAYANGYDQPTTPPAQTPTPTPTVVTTTPQTGDSSNIMHWMAAALVAGIGLVGATYGTKKRKAGKKV